MSRHTIHCPYCSVELTVTDKGTYQPFHAECSSCGKRFIAEPRQSGMDVFKEGEAPCCSDPDCRETELGASGQE